MKSLMQTINEDHVLNDIRVMMKTVYDNAVPTYIVSGTTFKVVYDDTTQKQIKHLEELYAERKISLVEHFKKRNTGTIRFKYD